MCTITYNIKKQSFCKEHNMFDPIVVDSVLETKASGCLDVSEDLNSIEGKTIAELLYDKNNISESKNT